MGDMLPTPSTSHVCFDKVYEPAEDSFLLLDAISAEAEFLRGRMAGRDGHGVSPLVVEMGTGSGIVLAFVGAHARTLFGRRDVLLLGTDVNPFACVAGVTTVGEAMGQRSEHGRWKEQQQRKKEDKEPKPDSSDSHDSSCFSSSLSSSTAGDGMAAVFLSVLTCSLASVIRPFSIDVLIFNPPYVPTTEIPDPCSPLGHQNHQQHGDQDMSFEQDSHLLKLAYAGGKDGMAVSRRALDEIVWMLNPERGVAYFLLCARNRPERVKDMVSQWQGGGCWQAETVQSSENKAGWEKLQVLRISRKT